jgi:hypothetical protein
MEVFIESLGYDAVLSEKGTIAYSPDQPLDESCYREVKNCDLYVLIIGGRYGSETSETKTGSARSFFERYESVTKMEYTAALEDDVPIYILIEKAVHAEYQTFLKNRDSKQINYAHVDSVNVFHFIDAILAQPRNNPIQTFEKYYDIESWLRIQWAGLFRELLKQRSNQSQLRGLTTHVQELSEVNKTLRRYLEEVVTKVSSKDAANLIQAEDSRLSEAQLIHKLGGNDFVSFLARSGVPVDVIKTALEEASTIKEFAAAILKFCPKIERLQHRLDVVYRSAAALRDFNEARAIVGKPPLISADLEANEPVQESASSPEEPTSKRKPRTLSRKLKAE